jgi:hypothetical protein
MHLIIWYDKVMSTKPIFLLSTSQSTDPLKSGALGRKNYHWSGAPLRDEIIKCHPGLDILLATASNSVDLEPYFTTWYSDHKAELEKSRIRIQNYLNDNWIKLLADVEELTNSEDWDKSPIKISISSLYPSSYLSNSHTIDLYFLVSDIGKVILHELMHLRTEDMLGQSWFIQQNLKGQQKGAFMELFADILFARSGNPLAQAARSPYPFF